MRLAIVGNGKMAEEMTRVCLLEGVEVVALERLQRGDVVFHFGSGRELATALAACARAGVPLIQGASSIRLPEPLPAPVIEAPNLALLVLQMVTGLEPLAGHVTLIRESHQSGKVDVSATARLMARQLGFAAERIESVRDRVRQLALGVPPAYLDGHAYHWIEAQRDGVEVGIAIRIHGREAYARGGLTLARKLSGRQLGAGVYSVEEVMGVRASGERLCDCARD